MEPGIRERFAASGTWTRLLGRSLACFLSVCLWMNKRTIPKAIRELLQLLYGRIRTRMISRREDDVSRQARHLYLPSAPRNNG